MTRKNSNHRIKLRNYGLHNKPEQEQGKTFWQYLKYYIFCGTCLFILIIFIHSAIPIIDGTNENKVDPVPTQVKTNEPDYKETNNPKPTPVAVATPTPTPTPELTEEQKKIKICEQIAHEYYSNHLYMANNMYDCDNMAQDVWNLLEAQGINSKIMIGNVDKDPPLQLKDCNHAWVLAETSPNTWLAIECTGGYVVYGSDNERYYNGFEFRNPKNYQKFLGLSRELDYRIKDYENYRLYYNQLVEQYNNADRKEQATLLSGLIVARDTLNEKANAVQKTSAELNTLLEYG